MSHWRGRGRWADDSAWKNVGAKHVELYRQLCALSGRQTPVRSMMEWGPGGGANAVTFARQMTRIYGVDISPANLQECGRQLDAMGYSAFRPIEIDASAPEVSVTSIESPVDFVLCTAVFQHFPSKAYGERVMRVFHQRWPTTESRWSRHGTTMDPSAAMQEQRLREECCHIHVVSSRGVLAHRDRGRP